MVGGSSNLEPGADPDFTGRPDETIAIRVELHNRTGGDLSFIEVDPGARGSYLLSDTGVTGGWNRPHAAKKISHVVPPDGENGNSLAPEIVVYVPAESCSIGQPQTPGDRELLVSLLVERNGKPYRWAVSAGSFTFRARDFDYYGDRA